jgi:chromosome segregation ATPase
VGTKKSKSHEQLDRELSKAVSEASGVKATVTSSGPIAGVAHSELVHSRDRLRELRKQREWIRRLREDLDAKKESSKSAKSRLEQARADLERMVSDSGQMELFAGVLRVDTETGEVLDYQGPDVPSATPHEPEKEDEP